MKMRSTVQRIANLAATIACVGLLNCGLVLHAPAEEPYERFLTRLREENLFDLALVYLEDVQQRPKLEPDFAQAIELERGLLYFQSAGFAPANTPQRAEKFAQAEKSLKKFVQEFPKHPRRGEARIKLGGLLQLRAEEALAAAGVTDLRRATEHADIPEAIRFFDEANQLFESTIAELAEVEASLRGDRVDPRDARQVAYREKVRQDLREAQLLSAKAVEDRGRSRATGSEPQRADLEKAKQMFSDLVSKEQILLGIRFYAMFYRGGINQTLGQLDDAIDGYLRIIDQEGVDALRPLQTDAVTELIRVLAAEGKYEVAVDRAAKWLANLRNEEQNTGEALELKIEYAKLRLDWLEQLKNAGANNNLVPRLERATREDLRALLRLGGWSGEQATALLSRLGVEKAETKLSSELPKVNDFAMAVEEAQVRIDNADSIAVNVSVLDEQLIGGELSDDQKPALQAQRDELKSEADQNLEQAMALVREGLRLYDTKSDDRNALFNARHKLAYLLLKLGHTREAIVVGDFLGRTSPATPQGLMAARIVLGGYSELMSEAGADSVSLMSEFAPFAEFLVANWPQSTEAAASSNALTQFAIHAKDWDRAEQYLQRLPESEPGVAKQYSQLGGALYDQFHRSLIDESVSHENRDSLRDRAARWLQLANEKVDADDLPLGLKIASALASLKLAQGDPQQAAAILMSGGNAPLKKLETAEASDVSTDTALDAYRTALRIVAAQAAIGQLDAQAASTQMQRYVDQLRKVASATEDGQKKLPAIFASIARDVKDKLALIDQPQQRVDFANVIALVMNEAAKSDKFEIQYWAASSLVSVAEELSGGEAATPEPDANSDVAKTVFQHAADLLKQMLATAQQKPDWVQPPSVTLQLKVLLARASEGAGDVRTALQTYGEILDQNESLLDIQMRVAEALQRSAANKPNLFERAIKGARPNAKTGNNVFWGWGKISQVTSRKVDTFGAQFFEARYQLAQCRLQWALSHADSAQRKAELGRAERAVVETQSGYPELGGPEDVKRFGALLERIRKEMK